MNKVRHFIAEDDLSREEFNQLILNAIELKACLLYTSDAADE